MSVYGQSGIKLTNAIFHIWAGTLVCKFLAIPDWLNGESESDNIRLAAE